VPGPSVSFLGGVREIGGNKIVFEDGPDRILFDFGPSFNPRYEEYYTGFLAPRSSSPVKDLLEFDLIPRVEGLYSRAALEGADLAYRAPEFHGVFVSHAHYDHAGYLKYLDPEIPVFVGAGTKRLLEAIEETGPGSSYGEHRWTTLTDRQAVRVGNFEIVPFPVDHSVPFAYGFLVRSRAGSFVYTGDFRHHGPRAADTRAFLEAAEKEQPAGLIIEGTRVGSERPKNLSEDGVRHGVDALLKETRTIALASTYPRDLDRIATLYRAALEADRTLLVSARTAHLLQAVAGLVPGGRLPVPGQAPQLAVYARKKQRFFKWERPLLEGALPADEVSRAGRRYLLLLDLYHFAELIDLRPPDGAPFVHSMSEPFSEDDIDDQVLHNWLAHFGLSFHQLHASGHVSEGEALDIARRIDPGAVYPVHTEHPEAFERAGPAVRLPEIGTRYPIDAAEKVG
jgi:ribonuclease J